MLFPLLSGFSSVLSIILNPTTTKFTDQVDVTSVDGFFHSNAWLGAATCLSSVIGGQLVALIADRYIVIVSQYYKALYLMVCNIESKHESWKMSV